MIETKDFNFHDINIDVINAFSTYFKTTENIESETKINTLSDEPEYLFKVGLVLLDLSEKYNLPNYNFRDLEEMESFESIGEISKHLFKLTKDTE